MLSRKPSSVRLLLRSFSSYSLPPHARRPLNFSSHLASPISPRSRGLSSQSKAPDTLLDYLRFRSNVDCDTLDLSVARKLGPFVDCTSNQAITYNEIIKPENEGVLQDAAR